MAVLQLPLMVETLGEAPWAPAWVAWAPQSSPSAGQGTGLALYCIRTSNKCLLTASMGQETPTGNPAPCLPSWGSFWDGGTVISVADESSSLHVKKE